MDRTVERREATAQVDWGAAIAARAEALASSAAAMPNVARSGRRGVRMREGFRVVSPAPPPAGRGGARGRCATECPILPRSAAVIMDPRLACGLRAINRGWCEGGPAAVIPPRRALLSAQQ